MVVDKPLIRPYFLGGAWGVGGVPLDSHEKNNTIFFVVDVFVAGWLVDGRIGRNSRCFHGRKPVYFCSVYQPLQFTACLVLGFFGLVASCDMISAMVHLPF